MEYLEPGSCPPQRCSVLIPAYEPGPHFAAAIRSVLEQDLGPEAMQIEVVDDASPTVDVETLVRALAGKRIGYYRQPCNVGLAANWNACIKRASGRVIHLLHQDDIVLPGFYEGLLPPLEDKPELGMAFCRHRFIDADGLIKGVSAEEAPEAGVLEDWIGRIGVQQAIQFASAIVRRRVYEEVGGFRADLRYVIDWEMWTRIAARFPVWFEPRTLAAYRIHEGSQTARLKSSGLINKDFRAAFPMLKAHFPRARAKLISRRAHAVRVQGLIGEASDLVNRGKYLAAAKCGLEAFRYEAKWLAVCKFLYLAMRLLTRPFRAQRGERI